MMEMLLGIDIGTSACKVALFDLCGNVLAQNSGDYSVYYPQDGKANNQVWAEQNPNEWWNSTCIAIKQMLERDKIDPQNIIGVGIDGQSWSAIAINKTGDVLCNTPIWFDTRADEICTEIERKIPINEIFALCGNPLKPSYSSPKILWYKKHAPHIYKDTYKILQSNSFIAYRLTGNLSQDVCQSYGLHFFDMHKGEYNSSMAKEMGIDLSLMPEIYACHDVVGTITQKAAALTGLRAGTPVVAGGLDAACATLGAGVIGNGQTQEQGGQAGGMSICTHEYNSQENLILSYHVVPNKWLLQGGTVGGGGTINWFNKEFCKDLSSFADMDKEASNISVGSDGVVFLPYMAGERSPIWDANAKGLYYGLDFSKKRAHLIRATMEGVGFSLLHNLNVAQSAGADVNELYAVGGAANSRLWTQIKADITGKTIHVPLSDSATTLGAAMLAGVGVGAYSSFEEATHRTVKITRTQEPNLENHEAYMKNYNIYLELYEKLKLTMKK